VEFDSAFQVYVGVMSVIVPAGETNVAAPGTAPCASPLFRQKNTRLKIVSIYKQSLAYLKYKNFIALILFACNQNISKLLQYPMMIGFMRSKVDNYAAGTFFTLFFMKILIPNREHQTLLGERLAQFERILHRIFT